MGLNGTDGLDSSWNFPFYEALRKGIARQAGNLMDVQLVHDLLPMLFDRLNADG